MRPQWTWPRLPPWAILPLFYELFTCTDVVAVRTFVAPHAGRPPAAENGAASPCPERLRSEAAS